MAERIVIVGAGFAGLACARALGSSDADVTIIDRRNYHLFVPLLYQVATAALSPADIAQPIRRLLRRHKNVKVLLGELTGVDLPAQELCLRDGGRVPYDALVLATGSSFNYFGNPEWEEHAPGLKTVEDARRLRSRLLYAFERAEQESDPERQQALMTSVVVGGGPTGVEMAGAIAELTRNTLANDFHHIDPARARTILVETGPHILSTFPEELGRYAQERLTGMGIEIRCNSAVEEIGPGTVRIGEEVLPAGTVIWGAGIKASPVAEWLGVEGDRAGRVAVNDDLSAKGIEGVFVLGDSALLIDPATDKPLPGLAQVAQQQGNHLGRALRKRLQTGEPLPAFRFRDRGNTAIIGRNAAVFDWGHSRMKGGIAWLLWAIIHVYLLSGFENRMIVSAKWVWRYFTYQRGSRLITSEEEEQKPVIYDHPRPES
ncbi:NAD(P)-binding protein [Altererythrobacter xixiisoli]|uniref:NADH:ubiquinone reductase (non-electrogenic) n=1 Tax=Croceibacterium xixiisoli TaxID=1476466 RepID=A0A6I4TRH3_9SPHN|nr:NAD(P)/FAD-dependent oxidoreductase [Croceibacterium xixiisoli]MXO97909.1 NAD(P)-binding protein [Croceibacterium xixiisoli]